MRDPVEDIAWAPFDYMIGCWIVGVYSYRVFGVTMLGAMLAL